MGVEANLRWSKRDAYRRACRLGLNNKQAPATIQSQKVDSGPEVQRATPARPTCGHLDSVQMFLDEWDHDRILFSLVLEDHGRLPVDHHQIVRTSRGQGGVNSALHICMAACQSLQDNV